MTKIINNIIIAIMIFTPACSTENKSDNKENKTSPQDIFFDSLSAHCGKAYAGVLVSNDRLDKAMAGKNMVISFTQCTDTQIHIPFHIEREPEEWDRSRTWVITRTENGLRLKHDHRHKDGSEDKITQYGGDTADKGSAEIQNFPVDEESKLVFANNGLTTSNSNIWSVGITKGDAPKYSYQMERINRKFRVEFDLSNPIPVPPPAWGHE